MCYFHNVKFKRQNSYDKLEITVLGKQSSTWKQLLEINLNTTYQQIQET